MEKFQRDYELTVTGRSGMVHTISYPITVEFTVDRQNFSSCNTGHFILYNLSPLQRKDILRDNYPGQADLLLRFNAGYRTLGTRPTIFQGSVVRAFSYRSQGDLITEIEGLDGIYGVEEAQVELKITADTWDTKKVIRSLASILAPKRLRIGAIGELNFKAPLRGKVWSGTIWEFFKHIVQDDGMAFIDLEKIHLLKKTEAFRAFGTLPKIDDSTGLLEVPRRQLNTIKFKMIFEPNLILGQLVDVRSTLLEDNNGLWRVEGILHEGKISGAVDGGATTSITAWQSDAGFDMVALE